MCRVESDSNGVGPLHAGSMDDFADAADLVDRLGACKTKGDMLAEVLKYRAAVRSAEREQWRSVAVPALEWMEWAWGRIDQEWGPSGKTLDQECADGDAPEIAAMRQALAQSAAT